MVMLHLFVIVSYIFVTQIILIFIIFVFWNYENMLLTGLEVFVTDGSRMVQ
jgi:hypothetical protein